MVKNTNIIWTAMFVQSMVPGAFADRDSKASGTSFDPNGR